MRIGFFGGYDTGPGYPRTDGLIAALRAAGHEVIELRASPFTNNADKLAAAAGPLRASTRYAGAWRELRRLFQAAPPVDAWVVGAGFWPDILWLRRLEKRRVPIALDAFFSSHEALVEDRRLWPQGHWKSRALLALERRALIAADLVLTDTAAHSAHFAAKFGIPARRFLDLPVISRFLGRPVQPVTAHGGPPRILFAGTYIPLQGIETLLDAAALLRGHPHQLTMVGTGQTINAMQEKARALGLDSIIWIDRLVDEDALARHYADADLALGVFGGSPKAARVIPCKVYDALALGRPVLTMDSPALSQRFAAHEVARCAGRPAPLASALRELTSRPDHLRQLAASGHAALQRESGLESVGRRLAEGLL